MENEKSMVLGVALKDAIGELGRIFSGSYGRAPVNNREPRPASEANRDLRAALMRRDGGKCWMCGRDRGTLAFWGSDARMVIDHLLPRSWFTPGDLNVADCSDNLAIACWSCNLAKSNRVVPFRPVLPIVWVCPTDFRSAADDPDSDVWGEVDDEWQTAWCDRCAGAVDVPPYWPLAALEHWGTS